MCNTAYFQFYPLSSTLSNFDMKHLHYLLACFILISCELVLDIDRPDFEPSLVVNSIFSPDSTFIVSVSEDSYILDNVINVPVEDATITLYENEIEVGVMERLVNTTINGNLADNEGVDFNFIGLGNSLYFLETFPKVGAYYRVEVEAPGYRPVIASEMIPSQTPTLEVLGAEKVLDEWGAETLDISVLLSDNQGPDYYELILIMSYVQPTWEEDSLSQGERITYFVQPSSEDLLFEDSDDRLVFTDDLFEGREYEINFSIYLPYSEMVHQGVDFDPDYQIQIEIRTTSETYYNYHRTVGLQSRVDGDPFSQPVQIFSNIENGFGIFAGYQSTLIDLDYQERFPNDR